MAGGTTAEGYGFPHQQLRAQWDVVVQDGRAFCCETVCVMPKRWIKPGTKWHLAHNEDRSGYKGPAHAKCNLAERNRRVAKSRKGKRRPVVPAVVTGWRTSRQW
jgi:hypothetical protein